MSILLEPKRLRYFNIGGHRVLLQERIHKIEIQLPDPGVDGGRDMKTPSYHYVTGLRRVHVDHA